MSAAATNHLYAEATFRNAQALIEREATAKLAYYAWNHRAGVPICMPFESLSLSEHQAWMDVVETVTDLVEDEPAECMKCYASLVCPECDKAHCPECNEVMECFTCLHHAYLANPIEAGVHEGAD